MSETISLDFKRPMAVFPLPGVVLLPHGVQALHIFEPRYRQMVEDCLESMEDDNLLTAAPIAMATYVTGPKASSLKSSPPIKPATCVGKIVQHQRLSDGRHNIVVQGICRARIRALMEPTDARLYRMALLEPTERVSDPPPPLPGVRKAIRTLLTGPRLGRMTAAPTIMEWLSRKDVSTHAILELVGFTLIGDDTVRYRLLAEPSARERAELIQRELGRLDLLLTKADEQAWKAWPKGVSWN
jgi:ATP-dependent Lon protease